VTTLTGFQEYVIIRDDVFSTPIHGETDQLGDHVGCTARPCATAYFGMTDIGRPQPGDTVVVSAAAGATGSVAGQIAKIAGARVVGIAGGPHKCKAGGRRLRVRRVHRLQGGPTSRRRSRNTARRG